MEQIKLARSRRCLSAELDAECANISRREAMGKLKTLLGRAAQTQEIVDFILYMASDKAAFITGSNHLIDGGRIAMTRG